MQGRRADLCVTISILVSHSSNSSDGKSTLWIIDFELAQVSLPPFDLGQMVAELYLLFHFTPNNANQLTLITAFLTAYGSMPERDKFRTVVVFGIHLVAWPWRTPSWKGESQKVRACAGFGAECVRAAVNRDKDHLKRGPLRALFV